MANVTDTLKQILIDQQRRIISGQEAVRKTLEEVKRQVLAELIATPAESFNSFRLQQTLGAIEGYLAGFDKDARSIIGKGLEDAWEAGQAMLPQMVTAAGMQLNTYWLSSDLLNGLKDFTWGKISGVRADAVARIRGEITLGILGSKTPHEVAGAIAGTLERPGVFKSIGERAEIITKTEMGRAFSMATEASMEAVAGTLPGLKKMWLHAGHPKRARIWHLKMHGNTVPIDGQFLVGNIGMRYPRDPVAPAKEVINCGCTHVPYLPEWGTQKEYLTTWDKAQTEANKPRGPYKTKEA